MRERAGSRASAHRRGAIELGGVVLSVVLLSGAAGCAGERGVQGLGLPGSARQTQVADVSSRAGYLQVTLGDPTSGLRFFFPESQTCRAVLRAGATVEYVEAGRLGQVRSADGTCEPVGVFSLAAWRDRRPRARDRGIPRSQAAFRITYQDAEMILLRGRFPLATRLSWPGAEDTIAAIPTFGSCRKVAERGVASMEFRATGAEPFTLIAESGNCPIYGLVIPAR